MRENLVVLQFGIFQRLKKMDGFFKAHAHHREKNIPSKKLRPASNEAATAMSVWTWEHYQSGRKLWSRRSGLNGRPAVYETAALPTELRRLSLNRHNLHGFFLSLKGFFAPPQMTETNRLQTSTLWLVSPTTATMVST